MSSFLPQSLAAALSVAGSSGGSWEDLAGELRLFMEAQQDALDTTRILNINLSQEVDQLKAQLLAIQTGRPSTEQGLLLSRNYQKSFLTLGTSMVCLGRNSKNGGHVYAAGDMKTLLHSRIGRQSPPCYHTW